jgi:hypothetical protein
VVPYSVHHHHHHQQQQQQQQQHQDSTPRIRSLLRYLATCETSGYHNSEYENNERIVFLNFVRCLKQLSETGSVSIFR